MTGAGIVLPDEDQAEVDRRFAALEAELAPSSELAGILVGRAAILSVRMDRCVREEAARLGQRMRAASGEFDDLRLAEAQKLFDWIAAEPATNSRRLRRTPEGVDLMLGAWADLADNLDGPNSRRWDYSQWQRLENLQGRRPEDLPVSSDGALSKALWGDQSHLKPGDGEGLEGLERLEWVRRRLLDRIRAEIVALRTLRDGLDHEAIALDRSGAMTRAILDDSREGILARKYEAATERGFYRALNELRQVEAEVAAVEDGPADADESEIDPALASFFPEGDEETPATPPTREESPKRGSKTRDQDQVGPS